MKNTGANRIVTAVLVALAAGAAGALEPADIADFSRYQVILDRQPFGRQPSGEAAAPVAPVAPVTPAGPPFVKDLRMCFIREGAGGVRVGIVDITTNPGKSYIFWIGDEQDGISLVDADYELGSALLRKDGVEHWIYMAGGSGEPAARPDAATVASVPKVAGPAMPRSNTESYVERLRQRRMAVRVKPAPERPAGVTPEEVKKQLQAYQMELIRAAGELGPPLPIPLTKEMDDQLVAEGVLPPAEAAPAPAAPAASPPAAE